ncbi:hypothetical protein D3C80_1834050 [compost metagenome]
MSLPARTPITKPPSAPSTSLSSTLPLTVPPSTTEAKSAWALGTSSTMSMTMVLVTVLPNESVA